MTGFESFVGVNPWTALFTFCNMLITFSVLKHFLFKPVKKMIDDRQQEIDTMYADADAAKQKAAALEQEYQAHLQSIKDERDSLLRDATVRAQKREEDILNEARSEAASIRAAAEADIAQERKKAVNDLKNERVFSPELGYQYENAWLHLNLNGYYSRLDNVTEWQNFFFEKN